MRPDAAALNQAAPDLPHSLIEQHLRRLDDSYFDVFDVPAVATHLRALATLSPLLTAEALVEAKPGGQVECTVVGFDAPGLFSLVTGILMSLGFSITSGDVYTYAPPPARIVPAV